MPASSTALSTATLRPKTDEQGRPLDDSQQDARKLLVDFNPETLQITLSNTVDRGQAGRPAQTVTESTARLGMTLVFDSTTTGQDVRVKTNKIASMMDPVQATAGRGGQQRGEGRKVPSVVIFEWGTIRFEGYIDSYREDLDFFSADGVPLRASLALSLTQQELSFGPSEDDARVAGGVLGNLNTLAQAESMPIDPTKSIGSGASAAGSSSAARSLAAANGIENLRLPGVSSLIIGAGGSGGAPLSFSSAAGSGGQAADGPFAALRLPAGGEPLRSRPLLSVQSAAPPACGVGIGSRTPFGVGGKALSAGSGSMGADVGQRSEPGGRIVFDE
jgi:hypothetical protein